MADTWQKKDTGASMKILMSCHDLFSGAGGIQTMSLVLAGEFVRAGHEVKVVSQESMIVDAGNCPFSVIRRPSPWNLLRLLTWSDILFQNQISMQTSWPLLFIRRPWVVVHHIWFPRSKGIVGLKGQIKRAALRWAKRIAVSDALAEDLVAPTTIIPNPYNVEVFRGFSNVPRDKDLIFVGNFHSNKGLQLALQALALLAESKGHRPGLTVVGDGQEACSWLHLASELGLSAQVTFVGVKRGHELAELLNAHRVLVVPSLWNEPFGIVALEGMACGCIVVGSEGGGLKGAIGPGGITFPNGDVPALADCVEQALYDETTGNRCRLAATAHLAKHHPSFIAQRYLEILESATIQRCGRVPETGLGL